LPRLNSTAEHSRLHDHFWSTGASIGSSRRKSYQKFDVPAVIEAVCAVIADQNKGSGSASRRLGLSIHRYYTLL
jgi:hypothetical protein